MVSFVSLVGRGNSLSSDTSCLSLSPLATWPQSLHQAGAVQAVAGEGELGIDDILVRAKAIASMEGTWTRPSI